MVSGRILKSFVIGAAQFGLMFSASVVVRAERPELAAAIAAGTQKTLTPDLVITYKTPSAGDPLKLHVFLPPKPDENRPAVIFFFGGGWAAGTPATFYPQCAAFAQWGVVAISAQYRTQNSHGTTVAECAADA